MGLRVTLKGTATRYRKNGEGKKQKRRNEGKEVRIRESKSRKHTISASRRAERSLTFSNVIELRSARWLYYRA